MVREAIVNYALASRANRSVAYAIAVMPCSRRLSDFPVLSMLKPDVSASIACIFAAADDVALVAAAASRAPSPPARCPQWRRRSLAAGAPHRALSARRPLDVVGRGIARS
jgi:hypothetical protein